MSCAVLAAIAAIRKVHRDIESAERRQSEVVQWWILEDDLWCIKQALTKVEVLADAHDQDARRVLLCFRVLVYWLPPVRAWDATLQIGEVNRGLLASWVTLTRMVMRGREERRTTRSREMTRLTATPISTFQMMVKKNVSDIRSRSIHARILCIAPPL